MKDNPESEHTTAGFLSRLLLFVRHPTRDWSELGISMPAKTPEVLEERQEQEQCERARRNHFIRKIEFARIRKTIQSRKKQPQPPLVGNTDFRPSMLGPELGTASHMARQQRAGTLQKIDAIEKKLAQQWWQTDHLPEHEQIGDVSPSSAVTRPATIEATWDAAGTAPLVEPAPHFTPLGRWLRKELLQLEHQPLLALWQERALRRQQDAAHGADSKDIGMYESDLEEAAILFASDRMAETESLLLDIVRKQPIGSEIQPLQPYLDVWLTLFDLYRATGNHEGFDTMSIEFASLFGRTAPVWFSIPELLGQERASTVSNVRPFSWLSPPDLSAQSLATATVLKNRACAPYQLNWSKLLTVQEDALLSLTELVTELAQQSGEVVFIGGEHLLALVREHTQVGQSDVHRGWWSLLLAILFLMGDQNAFDEAALDFTITYEESPPSWVAPKASYTDTTETLPDLLAEEALESRTGRQSQLQGVIENDAERVLNQAVARLERGASMTIECGQLIRIDFPAAGSVLNWAIQQHEQGRNVVFHHPHRLIAIFFNILGIHEYATIVLRKK